MDPTPQAPSWTPAYLVEVTTQSYARPQFCRPGRAKFSARLAPGLKVVRYEVWGFRVEGPSDSCFHDSPSILLLPCHLGAQLFFAGSSRLLLVTTCSDFLLTMCCVPDLLCACVACGSRRHWAQSLALKHVECWAFVVNHLSSGRGKL